MAAIDVSSRIDGAVLRSSLDGIISIDARGVVLEFNPAAERMFGYVRADAVGAELAELIIPPQQREAHRRGLRRALEGDEERILDQRVELEAQRADGSRFPVELAVTRMCGTTATYIGFIRDLSDHKLVEHSPRGRAGLSLGGVAQALGVSTTTARRWADDGRLATTRTSGGHRRFAMSEVRRVLADRGRPAIVATDPPRRPLPALAELAESHGPALADVSWRGLYGELGSGFFVDPAGVDAAERWIGALSCAAATANYEMLREATSTFMRTAERSGASLLERHLALERFAEAASRGLTRRSSASRDEIVATRRLFAFLGQRQLAEAG